MSATEPPRPEPGDHPPDAPPQRDADLSLDDERMNAWLDRQLGHPVGGAADQRPLDDELARDPGKQKEARTLAQVLAKLREVPREEAPKDLLADVQSDIRQKSRGRYFGYHWKYRFPYEALLNALLLIVALVVYVIARPEPARKLVPIEAKTFLVSGSDLGVGARILTDFGSFKRDPEAPAGQAWVHLVGEVAAGRMDALRAELSLYPSMRLDSESAPSASGVVTVHVSIKR